MERTYDLGAHALDVTEHTILVAAHSTETPCCAVSLSRDEAWLLYVVLHELFAGQQEATTSGEDPLARRWNLVSTPTETHEKGTPIHE